MTPFLWVNPSPFWQRVFIGTDFDRSRHPQAGRATLFLQESAHDPGTHAEPMPLAGKANLGRPPGVFGATVKVSNARALNGPRKPSPVLAKKAAREPRREGERYHRETCASCRECAEPAHPSIELHDHRLSRPDREAQEVQGSEDGEEPDLLIDGCHRPRGSEDR